MSRFSYYCEILRKVRPLRAAPKAWNYLKYRCLPLKAVVSVRRYTPQIGALFLTKRCNLDCSYCCAANAIRQGRRGNWRESEANLERVKRIFAHPLFVNCLLVDLMGGEPLLVADLDRIVAHLTERGHMTNTSTNGVLLAERVADLKQAGISRINVSLYDDTQTVMHRDLRKINHVFPVHTSLVLLRSVVESQPEKLLELARFVREAGCRSLRFWMYRPIGAEPKLQEVIAETDPAYLEFRRRVEEAIPGFCLWPKGVTRGVVRKRCAQLWQRVGCDALGNMAICCGTDSSLQGPTSNLFDASPDAVFNHPTLVAMRRQLLDPGEDAPGICKNCNLLDDPGW